LSAIRTPLLSTLHLSLRTQIGLALGLLSLVLLSAGAITLYGLESIRTSLFEVLQNEDERSHAAAELAVSTLQARRFEKDLLLNIADPAAQQEYWVRWEEAFTGMQVAIDELGELAEDADEASEVASWRAQAERYREGLGAVVAQIESGALQTPAAANEALAPFKGEIRLLTEQSLAVMAREDAEMEEGKAEVLALAESTMTLVTWIGAGGLLLALLMIVVAPRRLVAPLEQLRAAAEELRDGHYEARVEVRGSDEVARLGGSFNQMAATIQRQIHELDQTAVVRAQNEQLQQLLELVQRLETPVIRLYRDVLLVPLVGHIDGRRAGKVSDAALRAVHERKATLVLVDVTGLSEINTEVAKFLHDLAMGVRLLGARMILTGMRAEIAQVIVNLGLDIPFETMGQLEDGVSYITHGARPHAQN
jgi:anti-anti-sigma regulatory factor/HAMP domain-containing protein